MMCEYQHMFGMPREGVHALRVPWTTTAFVDYALTLLLAWFTAVIFDASLSVTTIFWMLAGYVAHRVFCVAVG